MVRNVPPWVWVLYLSTLAVSAYRSYDTEQTVQLDRSVTLIAGRNNVGKTAFLSALLEPADPTSKPGDRPTCTVRYTWNLSPEEAVAALEISGAARAAIARDGEPGRYEISALTRPDVTVSSSVYFNPQIPVEVPDGRFKFADLTLRVLGDSGQRELTLRPVTYDGSRQLWWADPVVPAFNQAFQRLGETLRNFVQSRLRAQFYISPRRTSREMPFVVTLDLESDGANITNVVGTLFTNHRHDRFPALESFMAEAFPEIASLEVPFTGGSPTTAEIWLCLGESGQTRVPLKYCGTGIEQVLVLATAVLTRPPSTLILLDGPHAYLHPTAERAVIRFVKKHSEHQYLVATHSPTFLTAYPLTHTRFVSLTSGTSTIADLGTAGPLLDELGVTAADLWSANAVLWVEGPSEVLVLKALMDEKVSPPTIDIAAMPDPVRDSARSEAKARATQDFCRAVMNAVTRIQTRMLFLFDRDERSEDLLTRIGAATDGAARFLPVREMENMFLVPEAIQEELNGRCNDLALAAPNLDDIRHELDELVADINDTKLYPTRTSEPNEKLVVGSEVLERLYRKWTAVAYDKVRDGPLLAKRVSMIAPNRLRPFLDVLDELGAATPSQAAALSE